MLSGTRVIRAIAIAALLLSTVSAPAFAAKAQDPEPQYFCFAVLGHPVCVLIG